MQGIEMGIQFIVVIVLAVLILTLGTQFIQNLFGQIEVIGTQVTQQAIDQLTEQLQKGNQKTGLTISDKEAKRRGSSEEFAVVINNVDIGDACFRADVQNRDGDAESESWFIYDNVRWIESGQAKSTKIKLVIPTDSSPGNYNFRVRVGKSQLIQDDTECLASKLPIESYQFFDDNQFILSVA